MIDSVTLNRNIFLPSSEFPKMKWAKYKNRQGGNCYFTRIRGVVIKYYPNSGRMTIQGKILQMVNDSNVKNLDDVYGMDIDRFLGDVNGALNRLFCTVELDIRDFTATRMDYCFNVQTDYVETYLDFLANAFDAVNSGNRKNFSAERGLSGSVYIKPKGEYEAQKKTTYALNFYDKEDWLKGKQKEGTVFPDEDMAFVKGLLRLEVQVYSQYIKNMANRLGIGCTFGELLDYNVAQAIMRKIYNLVFRAGIGQNFFKYSAAKDAQFRPKVKAVLERSAEHHRITGAEYKYGVDKIKEAGIYPYCFLPKNIELDELPNPLLLIENKIQGLS